MKKEYLPGWGLLLVLALISKYLSESVTLGGKHPLEASAIATILGLAIKNIGTVPELFRKGILAGDKLLVLGIVLMGASLDFSLFASQGAALLILIVTIMLLSLGLILALGKIFRLSDSLSVLLAVGTTICGTTAVAVTAPLIRAKQEETSYAVATIALFGLLAILLYPPLGQLAGVSDFTFGVFAGTAIHSTPQVVGAGFMFSDTAGQTATAIKLVRNCFMAPLAIFIAILWSRKMSAPGAPRANIAAAFPWFLFGYFVMAWCGTQGFLSSQIISLCTDIGKFLILMAMGAIGVNTPLSAFKSVGIKPLLVGFLGTIIVAGVSALAIDVFF